MSQYHDDIAVPDEVLRLRICEKMGWTFQEYDSTPAVDILSAIEIWRIDDMKESAADKA